MLQDYASVSPRPTRTQNPSDDTAIMILINDRRNTTLKYFECGIIIVSRPYRTSCVYDNDDHDDDDDDDDDDSIINMA